MGFWSSLRSKFGISSPSLSSDEIISYDGVREWVKSRLRNTVAESGFQPKSREYIDFLHSQSKIFSGYTHGEGREISELLKDTNMSVEDFLYLHEQIRRFLLDGNLRKEDNKELHSRVDGFEDFLVQSKIRSYLLLMERVNHLDDHRDALENEKKNLEAKRERLDYARLVVSNKKEELDELGRDLGTETNLSAERLSRLREEELSISHDLSAFFSVAGPLFDAYVARMGNPKGFNELIAKYRSDAVTTLMQDTDLYMLRVLDDILLGVERKTIGVKLENIDFIVSEIKRVDLNRMSMDLHRIYSDLKKKPTPDLAIKYKMDDLKYRMSHFQTQVEVLESQVQDVESRIDELYQLHAREIILFENISAKGLGIKVHIDVPSNLILKK